ncbi:MAG: hypothetical protein V1867_05960 [Candidatus Falkowbacteria bacterium]
MSNDINFISGGKMRRIDDSGQNGKNGGREVVWTKPDPISPSAGNTPGAAGATGDGRAAANYPPVDNTAQKNQPAEGKGFFSRINKIFPSSDNGSKDTRINFKKDKEQLAEYREVIAEEKNKRISEEPVAAKTKHAEGLFTTPQKLTVTVKKPKITNLRDFMDLALSFGRDRLKTPSILKTNLIKDEVTTFFDWRKNLRVLLINLTYTGLAISVIYIGLAYWESRVSEYSLTVINQIEEIIPQIKRAENEAEKIDAFQKKVDIVSDLFAKHIYWTNFFRFLEKNTLSEAYYIGEFSGDTKGEYTFDTEVSDYPSVADQITILEASEFVTGLTVKSARQEMSKKETPAKKNEAENTGSATDKEMKVNFSLMIKVKPDIFYK